MVIRNYSNNLKKEELDNKNVDRGADKNFMEYMQVLEDKSAFLLELKKRYNYLFKQLNTI